MPFNAAIGPYSYPNWGQDYIPTLGDWDAAFANKMDANADISALGLFAAGGTVARSLAARFGELADVADFLTPAAIQANDHTAAIQAAVNTGKPVLLLPGPMRVTAGIVMNTPGQRMVGYGRGVSRIIVDTGFNMSMGGVFMMGTNNSTLGAAGCEFSDFGIYFTQTDTATFTSLNAYPPAFYLVNHGRAKFTRLRIQTGRTGISFVGDCGGAVIDDLETSCLGANIQMDGCYDSMRFSNWHCWPYGITTNFPGLLSLFYASTCSGLIAGRCDDLHMSNCLWLCGRNSALVFNNGATGATFGTLTDCDLDTNGCIVANAGRISMIGGSITQGDGASFAAEINGGDLSLNGVFIYLGVATPGESSILLNTGYLRMIGCNIVSAVDQTNIGVTGGQIVVVGCQFTYKDTVSNLVNPHIFVAGGGGLVTGNSFSAVTTGTANAIAFNVDSPVNVAGNNMNGRRVASMATLVLATFSDNSNCANDILDNALVGEVRTFIFEVTADGSGGAIIPHGIANAEQRVIYAAAFSKNAAGAYIPATIISVDGTDISVSNAVASAPVRASLQIINQVDAR
jgi:hypothetical protein